jgi:TM2 domain-containing membrane protein YozV
LPQSKKETSTISDKKRLLATIICAGFGIFGAHRFYVGKSISGFLQLFTIGGLGIWYVTDFLIILFGEFTDREGRKIKEWI